MKLKRDWKSSMKVFSCIFIYYVTFNWRLFSHRSYEKQLWSWIWEKGLISWELSINLLQKSLVEQNSSNSQFIPGANPIKEIYLKKT